MPLKDAILQLVGRRDHTPDATCLREEGVVALREAAQKANPDLCVWHPLQYPGEISLPIHLLPLTWPLPPPAKSALDDLRKVMESAGISRSASQRADLHEHLQGHIWVATLAKGRYLPIGQAVFMLEERRKIDDEARATPSAQDSMQLVASTPSSDGSVVRRWWLRDPWLRPAYRCQTIFRHSVPYFQSWHGTFAVKDPWPALARALKEHPQHLSYSDVNWS
jgi:hypothetical protein